MASLFESAAQCSVRNICVYTGEILMARTLARVKVINRGGCRYCIVRGQLRYGRGVGGKLVSDWFRDCRQVESVSNL